jgi:flavoprotein
LTQTEGQIPKGIGMFKTEQSGTPKCKQCEKPMEFAAEIAPLGSRDGVRFFQCTACNTIHDQTIPAQQNAPRNEGD